jgi:hypothetical protein
MPDSVQYRAVMITVFGVLILVFLGLWWISSGEHIIKSLTENHNILLAAANVRDLQTFLVQDVAASPGAASHPYWYIHHPNLFAKSIALASSYLGLGLEAQDRKSVV